MLSRAPEEITVFDIIEVLEGPIEVSECLDDDVICGNADCCATRLLWARIKNSIDNVTKSTSLKDIVDDYKSMNQEAIKGVKGNE